MPESPPPRYWLHPLKQEDSPQPPRRKTQQPQYVELQMTSNFSFLRGASHPEELILQAASLGYSSVALTDLHSLAGVVRAHVAAKKVGISVLAGASVYLYEDQFVASLQKTAQKVSPLLAMASLGSDPLEQFPYESPKYQLPCSLVLHPTSRNAYGRLTSLLSAGKLRSPKGECFLSIDDIKTYNQGMHAGIAIHNLHHPELLNTIQKLSAIFDADRLSLLISNTYGPGNIKRLRLLAELAALAKLPLLATNDVHYHIPERKMLQDVLSSVRNHTTLREAGFLLSQNAERYLKTPQEMARLFTAYPQAVVRSAEIAKAAQQFSLDELCYEYPEEICPKGVTPQAYLTELTWEGAKARYPNGIPPDVSTLLVRELELIEDLRYAKYFLTVYDIVRFARSQKILCQGRGAAANSAVCYVLGVTSVDPDKIRLMFERFISKERDEPPDIDIDFEHERREEVIQYIYDKYGRQRAALTGVVITYRTRSAVRDVGKVFDLPIETIEQIIKLFTRSDEREFSDADLSERQLDPKDLGVQHTIAMVNILRGFPRHLSQHPGGFIISEAPLSEIVPIENAAMPDRTVIEWDKDDVESMGMLKVDVLGLGMLTCIRKGLELINSSRHLIANLPDHDIELHSVPQEDPAVYDMICRADTVGVFQIESRAQMSMLPRLKPRCFYDLVIEVAIVRPGPIQGGMVHPFLRRRSGLEKAEYPTKAVENILKSTLGVPIFQEQVMELAVVAADFTRGEADQLRRAMASWKRNKNALAKFETKLVQGMLKNGYTREFANRVYQQVQGFGEYGFPQSHAASFALLVYVSAWIKCHHPAVFAAALLNSQPMGFYQPAQILECAKKHGVKILPVDVNHSLWDCTLEPARAVSGYDSPDAKPGVALRLGLRMTAGLQEAEAEKITAARRRYGFFASPKELWRQSHVRPSALKLLAKADAFSSMGLQRQQALWQIAKIKDAPLPLFDAVHEQPEPEAMLPPCTLKQQVVQDYRTLGFSLKAHPLSFLRPYLSARRVSACEDIRDEVTFPHGTRTAVAGLVLVRQKPSTAAGVVFMTIEDETGIANLIIKPKLYEQSRDVLCDSVFLLAVGAIQREGLVIHVLLEEAFNLTPLFNGLDSQSRDFR